MSSIDRKTPDHRKRMEQVVRVYHNASQAARAMGVRPGTVTRWVRELGLEFRDDGYGEQVNSNGYLNPERWFS